jgi:hypothetical protein
MYVNCMFTQGPIPKIMSLCQIQNTSMASICLEQHLIGRHLGMATSSLVPPHQMVPQEMPGDEDVGDHAHCYICHQHSA